MAGYLKLSGNQAVLVTDDQEELALARVGQEVVVADCGGYSLDPEDRPSTACHCGRDCHSGSTLVLTGIEEMPAYQAELFGKRRQLENDLRAVRAQIAQATGVQW